MTPKIYGLMEKNKKKFSFLKNSDLKYIEVSHTHIMERKTPQLNCVCFLGIMRINVFNFFLPPKLYRFAVDVHCTHTHTWSKRKICFISSERREFFLYDDALSNENFLLFLSAHIEIFFSFLPCIEN